MNAADRRYKLKKYRTDPVFRAKAIERARKHVERAKTDPDFARLLAVRKRIVDERDRVARFLALADKHDKTLLALVAERDELAAKCKATRRAA